MIVKLFLDDWRDPAATISYMIKRIPNPEIYTEGWFVVRSFKEFKEAVDFFGLRISHVSFDYDLDMTDKKEKTGRDCAIYLKEKLGRGISLPEILVHSTNVTGIKKIKKVFS